MSIYSHFSKDHTFMLCHYIINVPYYHFKYVMNKIPREHKNIKISTPCLANEIKSNNKPLQGGKILIHHINSKYNMIQMERYP